MVKSYFIHGIVTKAGYAAALRGYQNSIEEMLSPNRDKAKQYVVDVKKLNDSGLGWT